MKWLKDIVGKRRRCWLLSAFSPFLIMFLKGFFFHGLVTLVNSLTLSKQQNLDSSKLRGFADDNFEFDENREKFFKRVKSTMGKGEIAHYEQFLAPLAQSQQAIVMAVYPSCVHPSVRLYV